MKVVNIQDADWPECVKEAHHGGVVITRNGKPLVVLVGVQGMDLEQVVLSYSDKFWQLIKEARGQQAISRQELENRLDREREPVIDTAVNAAHERTEP
jgi:hypothetical protein